MVYSSNLRIDLDIYQIASASGQQRTVALDQSTQQLRLLFAGGTSSAGFSVKKPKG